MRSAFVQADIVSEVASARMWLYSRHDWRAQPQAEPSGRVFPHRLGVATAEAVEESHRGWPTPRGWVRAWQAVNWGVIAFHASSSQGGIDSGEGESVAYSWPSGR